jgi:polyhydroxybutyrate depolymerase
VASERLPHNYRLTESMTAIDAARDPSTGPHRRRAVVLALLVGFAALLLGSCGGSGQAASHPTQTSSASPASGCEHPATLGSSTLNLTIGGHNRLVIVHIPTSYRGDAAVALVLNLHGSGSTAQQQELLSGMDATADQNDFIVAYPQALITSGSGFDWNIPGVPLVGGAYPPKGAASDVEFLTQLVHELSGRYCIDSRRVFATGISGGGRMSSQLACDSSQTFAAVAPVAGLRFPSPCPAARAVPVIAFHGTADPIDPYNGNGQAYWTYSVPTAAQRWAGHNRCRPTPLTNSSTGYTLTTYGNCTAGATVELYSLTGEGHEWPGGPPLPSSVTKLLGPQSDAVNANTTMWAFFATHPLP